MRMAALVLGKHTGVLVHDTLSHSFNQKTFHGFMLCIVYAELSLLGPALTQCTLGLR